MLADTVSIRYRYPIDTLSIQLLLLLSFNILNNINKINNIYTVTVTVVSIGYR